MSFTLDDQINQLKRTIAEMESQRAVLGDGVVDAALVPLRQKLADLEAQVAPSREESPALPTRQRKTYHCFAADWLISNSGDRMGEYSGLIAEHLLLAGKSGQACEYFSQAGDPVA